MTSALRGANCVYHLASYGMSGKEHVIRTLITCLTYFFDVHHKKNCLKDCYFKRFFCDVIYWIKLNYSRMIFQSLLNVFKGRNPPPYFIWQYFWHLKGKFFCVNHNFSIKCIELCEYKSINQCKNTTFLVAKSFFLHYIHFSAV